MVFTFIFILQEEIFIKEFEKFIENIFNNSVFNFYTLIWNALYS